MKMTEQLNACLGRMNQGYAERACVQATRLAGAIARMNGSYQSGVLTLQKLRTGGRQTVVVQHVNVNDGGQALVAGEMAGGGPGAWRGGEAAQKWPMNPMPPAGRWPWIRPGLPHVVVRAGEMGTHASSPPCATAAVAFTVAKAPGREHRRA